MKTILMIGYIELEKDPRVLREAKALIEYGNRVDVIGLSTEFNKSLNNFEGIFLHNVRLKRKMDQRTSNYIIQYSVFFILAFFKALFIGFRQRIDYYYFHNIPDFLVFIAFFPKILFGKTIVLDIHDPMSFSLKSRFNKKHDSFGMKLIRLIELASWKFSDLIITVNLRCKNLIEDGLKTKKKIEIVMNLPDRKIFEIDSNEKIKEFENRFVMLYTGTLTNWYGLDIAINALPALKKTIPNILLCIIGKGPEKISLLELMQNIEVRDALLFINPLPQKELIPYIKQCTVGITVHRAIDFSKIYFSTKVVEFLYCNKTVICAKTEGIVDYFSENDLFYFEPENIIDFTDKVIEIKNNPERVKKKLLSAKEKLKYLDWEIEKQKFHDIIK